MNDILKACLAAVAPPGTEHAAPLADSYMQSEMRARHHRETPIVLDRIPKKLPRLEDEMAAAGEVLIHVDREPGMLQVTALHQGGAGETWSARIVHTGRLSFSHAIALCLADLRRRREAHERDPR